MTSAHSDPAPVTVRVPAKVNLELLVGPVRDDGFHALSTVYQAVNLHDDVTVALDDDWSCSVTGPYSDVVPTDSTNLALRAARLLADEAGVDSPVHVSVAKSIPVAGGMAGGSADAAAALVACDRLWSLGLSTEELEEYAAELGSDVPFLIRGGTAVGSGRGERLAPVLARGSYHWVFAISDIGLSTPEVYAECDRLRGKAKASETQPEPNSGLMSALRSGDPHILAPQLTNDLQEAAISLRPELGELLTSGMEFGALGGIVSGSGPTVAFLVEDVESAIDLTVALTATGAAREVRKAIGPVHGAHVIPARVD